MQEKLNAKFMTEWAGSITGLVGAGVLAMNEPYSGWGFVIFLVSNAFLFSYARITKAKGLFILQIGFTVTSVMGILNWLFNGIASRTLKAVFRAAGTYAAQNLWIVLPLITLAGLYFVLRFKHLSKLKPATK